MNISEEGFGERNTLPFLITVNYRGKYITFGTAFPSDEFTCWDNKLTGILNGIDVLNVKGNYYLDRNVNTSAEEALRRHITLANAFKEYSEGLIIYFNEIINNRCSLEQFINEPLETAITHGKDINILALQITNSIVGDIVYRYNKTLSSTYLNSLDSEVQGLVFTDDTLHLLFEASNTLKDSFLGFLEDIFSYYILLDNYTLNEFIDFIISDINLLTGVLVAGRTGQNGTFASPEKFFNIPIINTFTDKNDFKEKLLILITQLKQNIQLSRNKHNEQVEEIIEVIKSIENQMLEKGCEISITVNGNQVGTSRGCPVSYNFFSQPLPTLIQLVFLSVKSLIQKKGVE